MRASASSMTSMPRCCVGMALAPSSARSLPGVPTATWHALHEAL